MGADSPIIGDDPRAPVEVDDMLMCESCLAIVDHVMTDLKKKVGSPVTLGVSWRHPGQWASPALLWLSDRCLAAVLHARDPPMHPRSIPGQGEESRSRYHWAAGRRL